MITFRGQVPSSDSSLGIYITCLAMRFVIDDNLVRLLTDVNVREVRSIIEPIRLATAAFFLISFRYFEVVLCRDTVLLRHWFRRRSVLTQIRIIVPALLGCSLLLSIRTEPIHALRKDLSTFRRDRVKILVLLRNKIS